jgi:FkbM family methyltransferase
MVSALAAVRKEPGQLMINSDGNAVKMQSNSLATNHEAVKGGLADAMGNYAWMHETTQVESAFHAAFRQWMSAVRGAKFSVTSIGDFVADPAITVPKIILDKKNESCASCQCAFVNRISMPANCDIEGNSRLMAVKWIPKAATVLEVGARYGSVSCTIARVLGNSGKQVSVDADERVWGALEHNRKNLDCNFHIAKGLLGTHDGKIFQNRYGTLASTSDSLPGAAKGVTVTHFTVDDLEKKYNLKFDTANFDCEGCFAPVSETFPEMFEKLKLMIVEVHDDKEAAAVAKLEAKGWETIDRHSRQHVLKRIGAE